MVEDQLPVIHLIGDPEENFYQLGLKDAPQFDQAISSMTGLINTDFSLPNEVVKNLVKL